MSDEVRDRRVRGWFWIANEVIDRYGKEMGAFGNAVYTAIVRRADTNGKSWPAIPTIAETFGISERQVIRELEKLEELKLISIEKRDGTSNYYTLLDIVEHAPRDIQAVTQSHGVVTHSHPTSDSQSPKQDSLNKTNDQGAAPRYEDAEPEPQTIEEADVLFSKCVRLYEVITKMPPNEMIGDEMVTASQIYGMEKMRRALLTAVEAKARIPWPYALKVLENDFRQAVGVTPKELQERKAASLAIQEENLRASEDLPERTPEEIEALRDALKKAIRGERDDS